MPRVTKYNYSVGMTHNFGNYESFRQDFGIEVELDESDTEPKKLEEIKQTLRDAAHRELMKDLIDFRKKVGLDQ